MDKNKNKDLDLFDEISKNLNKGDFEDQIPEIEPDELIKELELDTTKGNKKTAGKVKDEVDEEDLPENIKEALEDKTVSKVTQPIKDLSDKIEDKEEIESDIIEESDISELGEYEEDIAGFFTDEFSKELGWDINEEEKPKTVKEVVDFIKKVVEENSTPEYSDERIKNLDEFVKTGGKFEDFYSTVYQNKVSLDDLDIENENHQKAVLREHLQNAGYKESSIDRKIQRWQDAGVLQDEAEEAIESVREFRVQTEQKLLSEQKKRDDDNKKAQQTFFTNVDKTIKELDSIREIPLNEKKKKELLEYIFKPGSDGLTSFFKDTGMIVTYGTNPRRLLESAYFAKEGDTLVKAIERKVESKAAKNLKEKLATNKGAKAIDQGQIERNSRFNIFSEMGRELLPKQ